LDVELGQIQRHIRGNVSLPLGGLSEVPRAIDNKLYDKKKGIFRGTAGDCYIQFVKYPKLGLPEIESVNAYGASARKESKHYTDQMQMFVDEKTKTMTLDKDEVMKNAKETYHPGERK
jgi:acyl-homoserine-lactone acylase